MKSVKRLIQAILVVPVLSLAMVAPTAAASDAAEEWPGSCSCTQLTCDQSCGGTGAGVCAWKNGCPTCLCKM